MSVLAGLLLVGVLGVYAYQTKWPPRVDDRELARIGPPASGARPVGGPYTVSGSVMCVSECVTRGQFYSARGALGQVAGQTTRHLQRLGYAIRSGPACVQLGPPVRAPGHYELDCTATASYQKFAVSVIVQIHGSSPAVPVPAGSNGQDHLASLPAGVPLGPGDGILVEVRY